MKRVQTRGARGRVRGCLRKLARGLKITNYQGPPRALLRCEIKGTISDGMRRYRWGSSFVPLK